MTFVAFEEALAWLGDAIQWNGENSGTPEGHTMPRTKKNSVTQPKNGTPAASAEVLTLTEAAAYLRVGEADVLRLVREQALPARQIGSDWRFLKPALQDWLRAGPAPKGLLQLAGAIKDDPNVEEMLAEIYQARGRTEAEESECTSSTRTR